MIPIANLYYLLCYAWDVLDEAEQTNVEPDSYEILPDLLGRVLLAGVENVRKRGLHKSYQEKLEPLRKLRGSPMFSESVSLMQPPRGILTCSFEEFTEDVPHNRILKAALVCIARSRDVHRDIQKEAKDALYTFIKVSDFEVGNTDFSRIILERNTRHYRLPLHVARMILNQVAPKEGVTENTFQGFDTSDPRKMGTLFERFVMNFFRKHGKEKGWKSSAPRIQWNASPMGKSNSNLLPVMQTDIALTRPDRKTIIEAKFYGRGAFDSRHGKSKFKSKHLYQLFAYLENLRETGNDPRDQSLSGILLYADIEGGTITEPWMIGGHQLTIASVDLDRPWPEIHRRLLELGESF